MKNVTKTIAVKYIFSFYTPCRHKEEWSYCSTHSECLHQMAVNGQYHALASVPWGKATLCRQSGSWMGYSGGQDVLCKNQMCCSYRNRTPDPSFRTINTVSLFIIIFVTDFKLTGFECAILILNYERHIIYETKDSALNVEITG